MTQTPARRTEMLDDLLAALVEAEAALAVKASLRDSEQARVQAALDTARTALAKARGETS